MRRGCTKHGGLNHTGSGRGVNTPTLHKFIHFSLSFSLYFSLPQFRSLSSLFSICSPVIFSGVAAGQWRRRRRAGDQPQPPFKKKKLFSYLSFPPLPDSGLKIHKQLKLRSRSKKTSLPFMKVLDSIMFLCCQASDALLRVLGLLCCSRVCVGCCRVIVRACGR